MVVLLHVAVVLVLALVWVVVLLLLLLLVVVVVTGTVVPVWAQIMFPPRSYLLWVAPLHPLHKINSSHGRVQPSRFDPPHLSQPALKIISFVAHQRFTTVTLFADGGQNSIKCQSIPPDQRLEWVVRFVAIPFVGHNVTHPGTAHRPTTTASIFFGLLLIMIDGVPGRCRIVLPGKFGELKHVPKPARRIPMASNDVLEFVPQQVRSDVPQAGLRLHGETLQCHLMQVVHLLQGSIPRLVCLCRGTVRVETGLKITPHPLSAATMDGV